MDYLKYKDFLAHSRGDWTKHKYLSKYKKNGKWVYVYSNVKNSGDPNARKSDEEVAQDYLDNYEEFERRRAEANKARESINQLQEMGYNPYDPEEGWVDSKTGRPTVYEAERLSRDAGRAQERFARSAAELSERDFEDQKRRGKKYPVKRRFPVYD